MPRGGRKPRRTEYGLLPSRFSKIHREYHDIDYANKLSPADKKWLGRFMDEYYGSRFERDETDLHDTDELRRSVYNSSNHRRVDVQSVQTAMGRIASWDRSQGEGHAETIEEMYGPHGINTVEDALIAEIDNKRGRRERD